MGRSEAVPSQVNEMFGRIAQRYDLLNNVLSGGTHHLWKRRAVNMLPDRERKVIVDLCTGTGDLLTLLEPKSERVVGADFCLPMLLQGKRAEHFSLIQADGLCLPFGDNTVDSVTVSFGVRNFADPEAGLREVRRVLKPGSELVVLEFGQPKLPIWSMLYRLYSNYILPTIGSVLSKDREAYTYLPLTAAAFPCGADFEAMLKNSGLKPLVTRSVFGGIAYIYLAQA